MPLSVPQHELLEVLRDGEERLVYRSRFGEQATVTRIILRPVPVELAGLIEGVVASGVGSLAGLDDEIIATLEGYRVRSRLTGPGLPAVCAAGLASDPNRCPDWAGLPYITTRWMPGHTLRDAALPMPQRPGILRGVLTVLDGIHSSDVAYGDLKPQNIVLGPDGVGIIDLDTLRQVPAAHLPIRVTHRTPRYAAPEQEGDQPLLYLASDIYTFGLMACELLGGARPGEPGFPPKLEGPWSDIVDACLRHRPLDRPTAATLLDHLIEPRGPLPTWSGSPFAPATEPVRALPAEIASLPPVEHTARVPEPPDIPAERTARVAEPTDLPVEPTIRVPEPEGSRRFPRALIAVGLFLGLATLGGVGAAGLWVRSEVEARKKAEAAASTLMDSLRDHKTVAAQNNGEVLDGILTQAREAADEHQTPALLGLHALSVVWSQKWHYASASWSAERYDEGERVVSAALTAGSSGAGQLARGVLSGGACRLMPDSEATLRRTRCEESITAIDAAWQAVRWDSSLDWLAVEVQWAGVMSGSALARHLDARGDGDGARLARKDAMGRCQSGMSRLDAAPVNGEELVESCLGIAGPLERFSEYLEWSALLVGNELESSGGVSSSTRALIFESLHPDCSGMGYFHSGIPRTPSERGGMVDLCRYVGMVALGCPEMAEELRHCERESWGLREKRCVVYTQQPGVPWRAAISATASPALSTCTMER